VWDGRQRVATVKAEQRTGAVRALVERIIVACLPSLADVLFACVLLGVAFGLQGRALGEDGDVAWNLRIGSYVLAHGIPRTEFMLSSRLGQPTVYWEWLAGTLYAVALRLGGLNGVVALAAVLIALTCTLLFAFMRRRGVPLGLALSLALAATALTSIIWTARSQLFTLLLTLLWSECLWRYWRGGNRRVLWLFPLFMLVWVNLHAGFVMGLILLVTATGVAWLFPRQRGNAQPRDLTLTLLATLAATLVNPWGPELIAHVVGVVANPLVARYTQEIQSPDFHTLSMRIFLVLLFAVAGAWIWASRQPGSSGPEPLAIAHGAIWTALALTWVRFVPLWAVIITPLLGETLTANLRRWRAASASSSSRATWLRRCGAALARRLRQLEATDRRVSRGVWAVVALVWLAATVARGGTLPGAGTRSMDAHFDSTAFPVEAAERLHRGGLPPGRGFTTFAWGGYLDYALPEYHPFIDSRGDSYSQQLFQSYADIITLQPGWQSQLDRYAIRWALVPVTEPLMQVLALTPGWRCAPADGDGVAVLCQRGPEP
jgi:hypothetical protein